MTPRLTASLVGAAIVATGATALYWKGRIEGAARARPQMEAAQAQAMVAGLETRGERESAERVDAAVRTRVVATRSIIRITQDAQTSEDANAPLAPARAARLRAHDDQLCRAAPELAGCAATDDAVRGPSAVRAAPAAAGPDAG